MFERKRWLRASALVGVALLVGGCRTEVPMPRVEAGAGSPPGLGASFNVSVEADSLELELHVTNVTDGPVVLEFPDARRYDFAVARTDGTVVWRWSEGRMFAQMLGEERLAAGESKRFTARLARPRDGNYTATAWLTSTSHPVELRTVIRLPS